MASTDSANSENASARSIYDYLTTAGSPKEYLVRLNETTPGGFINKSAFTQEIDKIKGRCGSNMATIIDFYVILWDANYGWMEANNILSKFPGFSEQFRSFDTVARQQTLNQPDRSIQFTENFQFQAQLSWAKAQKAIKELDSAGNALVELLNPAAEEIEVTDRNLPRTGSYLLAGLVTTDRPADTTLLQLSLLKIKELLTDNGFLPEELDSLEQTMARRHPLAVKYYS